KQGVGCSDKPAVVVRGHSRTALDVEQDVVGRITDLTSEQAERIDPRFVADRGIEQADVAALEVGPVALRFNAEHPGAGLPAIADLATDRAARRVMGTFAEGDNTWQEVPATTARTPPPLRARRENVPRKHHGRQ